MNIISLLVRLFSLTVLTDYAAQTLQMKQQRQSYNDMATSLAGADMHHPVNKKTALKYTTESIYFLALHSNCLVFLTSGLQLFIQILDTVLCNALKRRLVFE